MMSVIIDHCDPIFFTFELEPAIRVFEFSECFGDLFERDLELERNGRRREGQKTRGQQDAFEDAGTRSHDASITMTTSSHYA